MSKKFKSDHIDLNQADLNEDILDKDVIELLGSSIQPVAAPTELRARVLEKIAQQSTHIPTDLHTLRKSEGFWFEIAPKVEIKLLHVDRQTRTRAFLMHIHPGGEYAAHGHHHNEECIVLEGEATIGNVRVAAGDFHFAPSGIDHGVSYSKNGAMLYIRASMQDTDRKLNVSQKITYAFNLLRHKIGLDRHK